MLNQTIPAGQSAKHQVVNLSPPAWKASAPPLFFAPLPWGGRLTFYQHQLLPSTCGLQPPDRAPPAAKLQPLPSSFSLPLSTVLLQNFHSPGPPAHVDQQSWQHYPSLSIQAKLFALDFPPRLNDLFSPARRQTSNQQQRTSNHFHLSSIPHIPFHHHSVPLLSPTKSPVQTHHHDELTLPLHPHPIWNLKFGFWNHEEPRPIHQPSAILNLES